MQLPWKIVHYFDKSSTSEPTLNLTHGPMGKSRILLISKMCKCLVGIDLAKGFSAHFHEN